MKKLFILFLIGIFSITVCFGKININENSLVNPTLLTDSINVVYVNVPAKVRIYNDIIDCVSVRTKSKFTNITYNVNDGKLTINSNKDFNELKDEDITIFISSSNAKKLKVRTNKDYYITYE